MTNEEHGRRRFVQAGRCGFATAAHVRDDLHEERPEDEGCGSNCNQKCAIVVLSSMLDFLEFLKNLGWPLSRTQRQRGCMQGGQSLLEPCSHISDHLDTHESLPSSYNFNR
eukprot:231025-Amphidinium_carterae.1